ncbi:hypothetical protein P175DRAFT_0535699 [Aspergillus ochraceoroseus IBT 24754]|uniref:Uncharacterized protein n=1 Tax=Aspergillus ochraceoroseus IBT 24754 TaxID=1392256 RepID=A0A2T5LNU0_9EURO|nr:uncharacterized protein P175DRAFT_0535699 [Aspergillus ochraceoroseus IBT 24754]PTU17954.1 hypothetical protein P175DRAFT_0535699 [Aspergillus ochraceoroseus IBT 24754]
MEEKALLIGRSRLSRTAIVNRQIKWYQIREALVDPRVWILFFFMLIYLILGYCSPITSSGPLQMPATNLGGYAKRTTSVAMALFAVSTRETLRNSILFSAPGCCGCPVIVNNDMAATVSWIDVLCPLHSL